MQFGDCAAPDLREHLVGELDDVEVVHDHDCARSSGSHGGPVASGHVDRDVPDVLAPLQTGGGQPGQDVGDGAPLGLASSPSAPSAPTNPLCHRSRISCHLPVSGSCAHFGLPRWGSSMPRTFTGQRLRGNLTALDSESVHHGRPGQMQIARGLDERDAGVL